MYLSFVIIIVVIIIINANGPLKVDKFEGRSWMDSCLSSSDMGLSLGPNKTAPAGVGCKIGLYFSMLPKLQRGGKKGLSL